MAPTWQRACEMMQRYCEAYFTAVERWRKYNDDSLLKNRLQLCETAAELLSKYSFESENLIFDLQFAVPSATLHDDVIPTAGKTYVENGDREAFTASKALIPPQLFIKTGIFFQSNLLKAIAGWNETVYNGLNKSNREWIIAAIEKLFRTPEEAGICHFIFKSASIDASSSVDTTNRVEMSELKLAALEFHNLLQSYRLNELLVLQRQKESVSVAASTAHENHKSAPAPATSGAAVKKKSKPSKPAATGSTKKNAVHGRAAADVTWTDVHRSCGTNVASFFNIREPSGSTISQLFKGKIQSYCPPSSKSAADQMYHVLWDDGDEQDFGENEFQDAIKLYDLQFLWSSNHSSVGTNVAAYFRQYSDKPYRGRVTRYLAATQPGAGDELYHIVWDDGDECDYGPTELATSVSLFASLAAQPKVGRKRKSEI